MASQSCPSDLSLVPQPPIWQIRAERLQKCAQRFIIMSPSAALGPWPEHYMCACGAGLGHQPPCLGRCMGARGSPHQATLHVNVPPGPNILT